MRIPPSTANIGSRQHADFSESTEEIKPLTEEEKNARLAELRTKLAEKRAGQSQEDKLDRKKNEVGTLVLLFLGDLLIYASLHRRKSAEKLPKSRRTLERIYKRKNS